MSSTLSSFMPLLSHSLQRLSEKVVSLGFPQGHFFDAGFDFTDSSVYTSSSCAPPPLLSADRLAARHLALTVLYGQSLAILAFLEANAIRALPSAADRRDAFGRGVKAEAFVSSVLLPYYERVTSSPAVVLSGLLPPSRVLAATAVGLSSASGEGSGLPTSAEDCEAAALSVVRALAILADMAIGLVAADEDAVAGGAVSLSTPVPAAALLVSSTSTSASSSAAAAVSSAMMAAAGERISGGGAPAAPVTPAEQRALEAAMIRLIGLFGLAAPLNTSNNAASTNKSSVDANGGAAKKSLIISASPYDLKRLTRMAARCVFLAQRIVLAPSDFGLSDAFEMLAAVPLFGGGSTSSSSSSATAPPANPLDQYTQALRLLLTLESELLQRFVTIVVDEAQSFTAQCAFDPSGHRIGF